MNVVDGVGGGRLVADTAWQSIRALRAAPTGMAATNDNRRRTFVAALRQAEELAQAADAAGYATKPLLLFYCLSQAGRAIAAAHLPSSGTLHGHGLTVKIDSREPVLDTRVVPASSKADLFKAVCEAVGSPPLHGPAQLGALWAANPDLRAVPVPAAPGRWLRTLDIPLGTQTMSSLDHESDPEAHPVTTGGILGFLVDLPIDTHDQVEHAVAPYRRLHGAFGHTPRSGGVGRATGNDVLYRTTDSKGYLRVLLGKETPSQMSMAEFWRRQRELADLVEIDESQPIYPHPSLIGHVLPDIAGGQPPVPLLLWWALLIGLSSLVRYEPAQWTAAIDLDSSGLAVSLERVLDVAAFQIPKRIGQALRGGPDWWGIRP